MTEQRKQQKPKIVLAEDNPVVRKSITTFLEKWGYEATATDNGDDALKLLEDDHSVQLAIVDWNLPGLSGIQICQRLRTRSKGPYVYTIMFSARKSHEEKIMALDGGADDYLVKPCKPSELRARIGVGRRIIDTALSYKNIPTETASAQQPSTAADQEDKDQE